MSNAQFIDEVIEREEEVNKNLQAIAEEVGLSKRDLKKGASQAEQKRAAMKAAIFKTGAEPDNVLAEGVQAKAEIAAALIEQNAANTARLADAVGVSSRDIAGSPGTTDVEEQKAALFGGGEARPDYDDMSVEDQKRAFFLGELEPSEG